VGVLVCACVGVGLGVGAVVEGREQVPLREGRFVIAVLGPKARYPVDPSRVSVIAQKPTKRKMM